VALLERRARQTHSSWLREELEGLVTDRPCAACEGTRLRRETRFVRVGGRNIVEVAALPIGDAAAFFGGLALSPAESEIARPILKQVSARLGFLIDVGLDYLTLDRGAATLSGGEGQRIRLATQIGSRLVGVLYILDEPSIGLHPRDNARLLAMLRELRDLGNSVIVVEQDHARHRQAPPRPRPPDRWSGRGARRARRGRRLAADRQGDRDQPGSDRTEPAVEPGDVHGRFRPDP